MRDGVWRVVSPRLARVALAVYWPTVAIVTHWPRLDIRIPSGQSLGDVGLDKVLHFATFALLLTLLLLSRLLGAAHSFAAQLSFAAILAGVYAYLDETTQRYFERTVSPMDLLANLLGVLTAAVVLYLLQRRLTRDDAQGSGIDGTTIARLSLVMLAPFAAMMLLTPGIGLNIPIPFQMGPDTGDLLELRADYAVHCVGATVLVWLMASVRPFGRSRPWTARIVAVALGILIGPAIEYTQLLVGRGFEYGDLIGHEAGVLLATIIGSIYVGAMQTARRHPVNEIAAQAVDEDVPHDEPTEPAREADEKKSTGGFVGAAKVVSGLTLLSRITGLGRDAYLAAAFGVGAISDAFWFGFAVPNLFRRLFGEGALTAAFIPVYTEELKRDRELARRLASLCLVLIAVVLGIATIVGELVLAATLHGRDWSPDTSLALRLTMLMLPYMPLVCLVALIGGILQVHGRFAPAAGTPILLNIVMIGGIAIAASGVDGTEAWLRRGAYLVGISVVAAGAVQLVWMLFSLHRHEKLTTAFHGTRAAVRTILRVFVPMLLALAVFQINTFLDTVISFALSPKTGGADRLVLFGLSMPFPIEQGGVAALQWSQRLYQFPLGVFGLAIATAIFPALAHAATDVSLSGLDHFRDILRRGLRLTVFIGLPASVGLILVRVPLARAIYERGQFDLDASLRVATILAGYAPAIWAYSMTHVLTRAFYAMKDSRTPTVVSVMMVMLNLLLNLLLVVPFGAAGLAYSTAICAMLQCVVLVLAMRNYVEHPVDGSVLRGWGKVALLTMLMAAALLPMTLLFDARELSQAGVFAQLIAMVGLGALVMGGGAWLLKVEELRWLIKRGR